MKRQVLFALFAALLVVTAVPAQVGAASGTLVVGSQHDTEAEFSAASLTNLTTTSSGDGAVELQYNDGIVESFEDGAPNGFTQVAAAANMDGSFAIEHTTATTFQSMYSYDHSVSASETVSVLVHNKKSPSQTSQDSYVIFAPGSDLTAGAHLLFDTSGSWAYRDGSGGTVTGPAWDADVTYRVEISNVDYTNNQYDFQIVRLDTGATVWDVTDAPFRNGASTITDVASWDGSGDGTLFDAIKTSTVENTPTTAEYLATHNVSNAEQAAINITQASNVSIEATVRTTGGTVLGSSTITSPGNHTIALADTSSSQLETVLDVTVTGANPEFTLADESILFNNSGPIIDNSSASPQGGEKLTSKGVTLSVDISDPTFPTAQGDTVTVEFQTKSPTASSWTTQGTDTLNANGTAQTSVSGLTGGTWEWRVIATDSYGATTTSQTFTFNVPDTLYIRNVTSLNLITGGDVTVTFYDGGVFERTTADGTVNLTGLPVETTMVVTIRHPEYHDRSIIIENIYEQQTAYLLSLNASSVEVRFELQDRTGQFEGNQPRLFIQRPINDSGTLEWQTVVADEFGVAGVTTTLETGQRYRLILENANGDTRILGTYTADVSETVSLTVGSIQPDGLDNATEWSYEAGYENTSSGNFVTFEYEDQVNATDTIWVEIHEYGNESNVLFANQSFNGPFGTFSLTVPVPSDELQTTWAIDVTVERNGQIIKFTAITGPKAPIMPAFPGWLMGLISVGSLWIVGGLFSQLNGDIGGLVIAGMGAIYWYLGFLPQEIGQGVVALALIMAGIVFINERRGEAGL